MSADSYTRCGTPLVYAGELHLRHEIIAKSWTDDQLADYECALETIGNVIALRARDVEEEKAKPVPSKDRIAELRLQQAELIRERSKLRIGDRDAIACAIDKYGKLVRASAQQGHSL
ncbi:hypothetical protein [Ralstonia pseudosolanacearum]|uniref:hypothetical protein n=1 Tax=Ralstonia pseudosolanacearum TaxID=1310165 RepID=UPI0020059E52|nr:hypothetical protein [Ralstonia pseudosolanacearum]